MNNLLFKLCGYALLGIVAIFIIWRFAWYAAIGLIIFGFFYFGFKSIKDKRRNRKNREEW